MPVEADLTKINIESPKREIKEEWLADNPGMGSADFETTRQLPEFKTWEHETTDWTAVMKEYWADQNLQIVGLAKLDVKLDIARNFSDPTNQTKLLYDRLINRFGDSEFFGTNNPVWSLPDTARPEWKKLIAKKQAQVQRSARNLSSVISRTKVLANEELSLSNITIPDATKTTFKSALENLEKVLAKWDKLLSENASPDVQELRNAADELNTRLNEFRVVHAQVFSAPATPLYIKYEVLATVKAVSDKIASQFSARVTEPDLTGMYDKIIDVSRSTRKKETNQACKEISSAFDGDLKGYWEQNMGNLQQIAARLSGDLPTLGLEIKTAMYNLSGQSPIGDSLRTFSDSMKTVRHDELKWIFDMSSSVGEVTFQIPKYREAIERVFDNYSKSASARQVRDQYLKLFDTVMQFMQTRVEVLQEIM
ncbi:MAG: hypothetical protein QM706_12970 [Nitrospira sp.]